MLCARINYRRSAARSHTARKLRFNYPWRSLLLWERVCLNLQIPASSVARNAFTQHVALQLVWRCPSSCEMSPSMACVLDVYCHYQ